MKTLLIICLSSYPILQVLAIIEHLLFGNRRESALDTIIRWNCEDCSGTGVVLAFSLMLYFVPAYYVTEKVVAVVNKLRESHDHN